jgi:Rhodopirellula transposase DDE domain/Winged helix-turn helix
MKRDLALEAILVEKFSAVSCVLDERGRRLWAAAESRVIGYGGDSVVSAATGLAWETIHGGRAEIEAGGELSERIRRSGAGRPFLRDSQPGLEAALERLVDPETRGDPVSPLRWTCKSRAKLAAALSQEGWRVSSTTVGRMLNKLGYRLQSARKRNAHPEPALGCFNP